jgi:flagellar protein FlaG
MSLEVISGAVYHDPAKIVPKQRTEMSSQEQSVGNMNITEVPGSVIKTEGSNQTGKDQSNGNNHNPNGATDQQIKSAISRANSKIKTTHRTRCEFSYHEETKRISIKVFDNDTDKVIREIPPEETLDMLERMWDLAGILIDEKR